MKVFVVFVKCPLRLGRGPKIAHNCRILDGVTEPNASSPKPSFPLTRILLRFQVPSQGPPVDTWCPTKPRGKGTLCHGTEAAKRGPLKRPGGPARGKGDSLWGTAQLRKATLSESMTATPFLDREQGSIPPSINWTLSIQTILQTTSHLPRFVFGFHLFFFVLFATLFCLLIGPSH